MFAVILASAGRSASNDAHLFDVVLLFLAQVCCIWRFYRNPNGMSFRILVDLMFANKQQIPAIYQVVKYGIDYS